MIRRFAFLCFIMSLTSCAWTIDRTRASPNPATDAVDVCAAPTSEQCHELYVQAWCELPEPTAAPVPGHSAVNLQHEQRVCVESYRAIYSKDTPTALRHIARAQRLARRYQQSGAMTAQQADEWIAVNEDLKKTLSLVQKKF